VGRWNRVLQKHGLEARIMLPHKGFNRRIGAFADARVAPDGRVITEEEWRANERQWLPTGDDRAYVASLMGRVVAPGRFANWIAPPATGVNRQPIDFEYVRFN
jgi:benzoyl-CoA 2,3-dioxygenase component B